MGNKNYNNFYNPNRNENAEHSHDVPVVETSINEVENIEMENVNETIVESTDPSTVETTPISDINENVETPVEEETTGSTEEIQNESNSEENVEHNVQKIRVIAKALNVRKEANKDSDVVMVVHEHDVLVLCESTIVDSFYHVISDNGVEGYCMEKFVELI